MIAALLVLASWALALLLVCLFVYGGTKGRDRPH